MKMLSNALTADNSRLVPAAQQWMRNYGTAEISLPEFVFLVCMLFI